MFCGFLPIEITKTYLKQNPNNNSKTCTELLNYGAGYKM